MKKKVIVLLSGGLDSATCLYWAKARGYEPLALLFDYGQRHRRELLSGAKVARKAGAPFQVVKFSLPWSGSALTDSKVKIPTGRNLKQMSRGIPATYVPARNTVFLSFALSYADAAGAEAIVIGANAIDYSGYPDCRPEFIRSFQETANLAVKAGVEGVRFKVHAPLVELTKADIVELGTRLGVPYHLTHSCYAPTPAGLACGGCDSCVIRRKGFEEAGVPDPTRYAAVA